MSMNIEMLKKWIVILVNIKILRSMRVIQNFIIIIIRTTAMTRQIPAIPSIDWYYQNSRAFHNYINAI